MAAWIGTVMIFRLPYFGPLYFIACLSYLTPEEWKWITSRLRREAVATPVSEPTPAATPQPRSTCWVERSNSCRRTFPGDDGC